jgi:hypothetical protein
MQIKEERRRKMKGEKENGEGENKKQAKSTHPANGRTRKRESSKGKFP